MPRKGCTPAATLFTPQSSCGPAVQELHSQALPIALHACSRAVRVFILHSNRGLEKAEILGDPDNLFPHQHTQTTSPWLTGAALRSEPI